VLLSALAHNVLVWARGWLAPHHPRLAQYGIKRLVRDIWQISGCLEFNSRGEVIQVVVNLVAPLAPGLIAALRVLLAAEGVAVNLGEI
jgi:hypothetical protein